MNCSHYLSLMEKKSINSFGCKDAQIACRVNKYQVYLSYLGRLQNV